MIGVRLIGGLGNQMFQYAAGRALSLHLGVDLVVDVSAFNDYKLHSLGLDSFNIESRITNSRERLIWHPGFDSLAYRASAFFDVPGRFYEKGLAYDGLFWTNSDGVFLFGYFQSEKYFKNYRNQLMKEFKLNAPLSEYSMDINKKINDCYSISLHIRRGDYINDPVASEIHGFCGLNYYKRSMEYFKNQNDKVVFFVFSDDIDWAKSNLSDQYNVIFVDGFGRTQEEDLFLMSRAKGHIIANSSFSWWGAWLGEAQDKQVVAPSRWFSDMKLDSSDIVPESWVRI